MGGGGGECAHKYVAGVQATPTGVTISCLGTSSYNSTSQLGVKNLEY